MVQVSYSSGNSFAFGDGNTKKEDTTVLQEAGGEQSEKSEAACRSVQEEAYDTPPPSYKKKPFGPESGAFRIRYFQMRDLGNFGISLFISDQRFVYFTFL